MNQETPNKPKSALKSPSRMPEKRSYFNNSQPNIMEELDNTQDSEVTETHHIIKFKATKPQPQKSNKKSGPISKARQAIKKRLGKKKVEGKSYASDTEGIEASIKLTRSETFMNKIKRTSSKLKPSGDIPTRGRSLERRKGFSLDRKPRSLSMNRTKSFRSLSRKRSKSTKPSLLSKAKSFRRDRSLLSVRSVRSTRSNFSVKSNKKSRKGFFGFFKRKSKHETTSGGERVLYVKQDLTSGLETAPTTPEEPGFFDGIFCSSLDVSLCRDLFSRTEDVGDVDHYGGNDDDPRYVEEGSFIESLGSEQQENAIAAR